MTSPGRRVPARSAPRRSGHRNSGRRTSAGPTPTADSPSRRRTPDPAGRSATVQHHGEHSREMRWSRTRLRVRRQAGQGAPWCADRRGYMSAAVGRTPPRRPRPAAREVVVERPGIGVEILARAELQRVDEDRNHHDRARHPLGRAHQCEMTVVQRAHRRHQHHPPPGVRSARGHVGHVARAAYRRSARLRRTSAASAVIDRSSSRSARRTPRRGRAPAARCVANSPGKPGECGIHVGERLR